MGETRRDGDSIQRDAVGKVLVLKRTTAGGVEARRGAVDPSSLPLDRNRTDGNHASIVAQTRGISERWQARGGYNEKR